MTEIYPGRVSCCVPFCKRTLKTDDAEVEWLCKRHFALASREARVEYDAAWHEAAKADKRLVDGLEISRKVYVRVTDAWKRVKDEALKAAMELS